MNKKIRKTTKDISNYKISARDYLKRARLRLDDGSFDSLFYAAFELRCGVEARMEEYLDSQKHLSKKKKKGWEIAKLGKNLEKTFKSGDKIVQIKIIEHEGENIDPFLLYYTPVTSKLKKLGQRLGNYLHSMKSYKKHSDNWWNEFRELLEYTYFELERATTGNLLGPPMINKKTGNANINVEGDSAESNILLKIFKPGTNARIEVNYLEEMP